jgi:hypothetical protein
MTRKLAIPFFGLLLSAGALTADSSISAWMPRIQDYTEMWWANGPRQYHVANTPPSEPILCMQSGALGLVIDTEKLRILHAGKFRRAVEADAGFLGGDAALLSLPPMPLDLSVLHDGRNFVCHGRGSLPADAFYFPVRFIESGRFLQRIAIEDLQFIDAGGNALGRTGRLEIALWPDRLTFAFSLASPNSEDQLNITVGKLSASGAAASVELFSPAHQKNASLNFEKPLATSFDKAAGCFVVNLPHNEWQRGPGSNYPRSELDRLDRWPFTVRNDEDVEVLAPIMFVDERPPAITGFTPLLCDREGNPTGLPVQISKNWHQRKEKGDLPHQGPWFHGCTFIRVPPHAEREFIFSVAYARYGGIPAASHAQLSLIGWGINQFWDEAAIGSFGESICYEPGRVQRRCFIDDVRPLMTLPDSAAKPYGWAGNAGGGDFLMWLDEHGRYQGFRRTRVNYQAYGPCLTDVRYREETAGGELTSSVRASICRSDDYLRAFYHIRYDARKSLKWSRLAFFQLGADFYNDTPSRLAAIGDETGMKQEWKWPPEKQDSARETGALLGRNSWISFHDVDRSEVGKGGAVASRGFIVRSWKAVLNGRPCSQPSVSFFTSESRRRFCPAAELVPPSELKEMRPGDFIEADLELVVFPADASAYYGSNGGFRDALGKDADTWRLVHREAAGNSLAANCKNGKLRETLPLVLAVDRRQGAVCELNGGIGCLPVSFEGVKNYRGFELLVDDQPLNQAVHGNDFWQTVYDPKTATWRITYNLPRDGMGKTRLEFRPVSSRTVSSKAP